MVEQLNEKKHNEGIKKRNKRTINNFFSACYFSFSWCSCHPIVFRYKPKSSANRASQSWEPSWKQRLNDRKQKRQMYKERRLQKMSYFRASNEHFQEVDEKELEWEDYLDDISSRWVN